MTRKQQIYEAILARSLPHLRNVATWPWWRRLLDRSAAYESELIHNLTPSLFEPDFMDHDIWFLNVQARAYCEQCSERLSPLYVEQVSRIRELLSIVPDGLRDRLEWEGPT